MSSKHLFMYGGYGFGNKLVFEPQQLVHTNLPGSAPEGFQSARIAR
jgi:hypothetical protein